MIRERKTMMYPLWVEAILVAALLAMAIVEAMHAAWGWAVVFGVGFVLFGISMVVRGTSGDKHGRA